MVDNVQMVVLPHSLLHVHWRASDQCWRVLPEEYATDGAPDAVAFFENAWARWTGGTDGVLSGSLPPNAYEYPTAWWAVYGETPLDGSDIVVVLADDSRPPVHRVGNVWASEWVGPRNARPRCTRTARASWSSIGRE